MMETCSRMKEVVIAARRCISARSVKSFRKFRPTSQLRASASNSSYPRTRPFRIFGSTATILNSFEMLEMLLLQLPLESVIVSSAVCKRGSAVIAESTSTRRLVLGTHPFPTLTPFSREIPIDFSVDPEKKWFFGTRIGSGTYLVILRNGETEISLLAPREPWPYLLPLYGKRMLREMLIKRQEGLVNWVLTWFHDDGRLALRKELSIRHSHDRMLHRSISSFYCSVAHEVEVRWV